MHAALLSWYAVSQKVVGWVQAQQKVQYSWWVRRLGRAFQLYDETRIDHFRGFAGTMLHHSLLDLSQYSLVRCCCGVRSVFKCCVELVISQQSCKGFVASCMLVGVGSPLTF